MVVRDGDRWPRPVALPSGSAELSLCRRGCTASASHSYRSRTASVPHPYRIRTVFGLLL